VTVPPAIDAALLALGRQSGLSSVLRALERAVDLEVLAAFERSSAYSSDIAKASDLLHQCLAFAGSGSATPGDKLELPRLERLAAGLEALVTPAVAAPRPPVGIVPRLTASTVPPTASPAAGARPFRTPAPRPPARTERLVEAILSKLARLFDLRRRLLHDALASWRDFRIMDRKMRDAIEALRWVGEAAVRPAKALLAAAETGAEGFAAALALIYAGGGGDLVSLLAGPASIAGVGEGVFSALRSGGDPSLWPEIVARVPAATSAAANHLSDLADRGQLSADTLLDLLDHGSDAVAVRAAELLAWLGRPPADTRTIEDRLRGGIAETRFFPFLFAAVALGSVSALDEIRKRMDAGDPLTEYAVDALACAGTARDCERLLTLASRDEALAPSALLAVGHLGDRGAADRLAAGLEPKAVAERAIQMIVGSNRGKNAALPKGARLLHGEVWSLSGALVRLGLPDELLRARRWLALEVAVRSGARPPRVVDLSARVAVQEIAVTQLRAAIEAWRRPIRAGAWYYFGRPAA
jgi:hypothetical protein